MKRINFSKIRRIFLIVAIIMIFVMNNCGIYAEASEIADISINNAITGNLNNDKDTCRYNFEVSQYGSLTIKFDFNANINNFAWSVYLYQIDSSGSIGLYQKSSIGLSAPNANSYKTVYTNKVRFSPGKYFIVVSYRDSNTPNYYDNWSFSNSKFTITPVFNEEPGENYEKQPNGTIEKATNILLNSACIGNLDSPEDIDLYKVELKNTGKLGIKFDYDSRIKIFAYSVYFYTKDESTGNLSLYDKYSIGNSVVSVNSTKSDYLSNMRLPAGIYYIRVAFRDNNTPNYYSSWGFCNLDYSISVNFAEENAGFEHEWNNMAATANVISEGNSCIGNLNGNSNDYDFYKITFSKSGANKIAFSFNSKITNYGWSVYVYGLKQDGTIYLISKSSIGESDVSANATKSYILNDKYNLGQGTYYVRVSFHDSDTPNYYSSWGYSNSDYKISALNASVKPQTAKPAAISVPKAPVNFKVDVKGTKAKLSWSSVAGASSYKVYYKKNGSNYLTATVSGTNAQISGLKQVSKYFFKVAAINSAGQSGFSKEITKNTSK